MKTDGYYKWLEETSKRKEMAAEQEKHRVAMAAEQEKHRVAEAMLVLGSSLIVIGVCTAYWLWK